MPSLCARSRAGLGLCFRFFASFRDSEELDDDLGAAGLIGFEHPATARLERHACTVPLSEGRGERRDRLEVRLSCENETFGPSDAQRPRPKYRQPKNDH